MTKTPETAAFKDDFTKDFMDSPKEVKDGYYLFKSKTGGYTMLFPVNAELSSMPYEKHKNYFEAIYYGQSYKNNNITYYVKAIYEDKPTTKDIEANLDFLTNSLGYKGDYKKFNFKGKTYYYAKAHEKIGKKNPTPFYSFFSYIKQRNSHKALSFIYTVTCADNTKKCDINNHKEEERAKMLMKSVEFES